LGEEERRRVLVEWNRAQGQSGTWRSVVELIAIQAARTPDAVAVCDGKQEVSYRELEERSGRLSRYLNGRGLGAESKVGVCLERSAEMVAAVLGILKAGCAYVPLDPSYPEQRLGFMLKDSGAALLLTERRLLSVLPEDHGVPVACLPEDEGEEWGTIEAGDDARVTIEPEGLAYVIYTSGSTGMPKGVAVAHRGLGALMTWAAELLGPNELGAALGSTAIGFDVSVFEMLAPLCHGGTLYTVRDPLSLADEGAAPPVSMMNVVPSVMGELLGVGAVPPTLRTVCLAGERLRRSLVDRLFALPHVDRVLNIYGPTEATVFAAWTEVRRDDRGEPGLGRGVAGTQVYVLDERLAPVPVGVPGELCLGGVGLARGYLNQAGLTAERFVPDPYGRAGARLYHTGDRVRWRSDGTLEYLGRIDDQVKVRGFRIELGEIESVLSLHPDVEAVAVVPRGDDSTRRLVAYVQPRRGVVARDLPAALRRHARARLPEYMCPNLVVPLEALPRTPTGKVDRRSLPAGDGGRPTEERPFVSPRNALERTLAQAWAEVLGVERVSVHDDFFELGGHSLLATQLVARIREVVRRDLPLRSVFESRTVAGLAEVLAARGPLSADTPVTAAPREGQRLDDLLAEIDALSDAQAAALLEAAQPEPRDV
jgi:amino acid adenylation domain-containing protein